MRTLLLTLLVAIFSNLSNYAQANKSFQKELRDSIFSEYNQLNSDKLKIQYMIGQYQNYIGQLWAVELLDTVYTLANNTNNGLGKIEAAFEYVRNYQYNHDRTNFDLWFERLKKHSYEHNLYNYYISAWNGLMQYSSTAGNTEYVILESQKMEEELKRVGYEGGIQVVRMTLAQAYANSEKYDKAIAVYKKLLNEDTTINKLGKIKVNGRLCNLYTKEGKYDLALEQLQMREKTLRLITDESDDTDTLKYRNHWISTYTLYSRIYIDLNDKENLLKYNRLAAQYYYPQCFYTAFINYHTSWASYYSMTGQYDKAFKEYDTATSIFRNNDIPFENKIRKMEIETYKKAGEFDKAIVLQERLLHKQDSLIKAIDQQNEALHRTNYEINKALYDKEKVKLNERLIESIAAIIAILLLGYCIVYYIQIRRKLQRSEAEIRKALVLTQAAEQLKTNFLHNITYEIRIPLNSVVGFSDILCQDKNLSKEEREEYSHLIKNNTIKLIELMNNILDLSRLESGMMKFTWEDRDPIQLCFEAKTILEMRNNRPINMHTDESLGKYLIQTDTRWFLRVLLSTLSDCSPKESCKSECEIKVKENKLYITMCNCAQYNSKKDEQHIRITNSINSLFVKACKGEFQEIECDEHRKVLIIYPLL